MMILALADNTALLNLHPHTFILSSGSLVQKTKDDATVLPR
jgi:hypothetical protein